MKARARLGIAMLGGVLAAGLCAPAVVHGAPQMMSGGSPNGWTLPANNYSGNRYVGTSQISPSNVTQLHRAWRFKITDDSPIETSPIVSHGTVYLTSAHDVLRHPGAYAGLISRPDKNQPVGANS